uniref:NADPH--hemoprotein reductase n=1 Tax=Bionectria ochroleuca TaxID=29856 RepID=A0A8H7NEB1_BIOOC
MSSALLPYIDFLRPSLPLGQQQLPSLPQTQGDIAACLALAIALGFGFASHGTCQILINMSKKLEENNKDLVVFWGSQSGTAEEFANRLARECYSRFGLDSMPADLSDYDPESLSSIPESKIAIFILSTYGEGDPSDNAAGFYRYLQHKPSQSLGNIQYVAFGLGNSNYQHYNRVVDVVVTAIDGLGARALMPVTKADDADGNTEEQFLAWKESVLRLLQKKLDLTEREPIYEPKLQVEEDESLDIIDLHSGEPTSRDDSKSSSVVVSAPISHAMDLLQNSSRNCVHLDVDLSAHPTISYKTGDHIAVWPVNPAEEVDILLGQLGLRDRRNIPIIIKSLDSTKKIPVPTPTSTETLFKHYLEISAAVSADTLASLLQFAPSSTVRSFLSKYVKDRQAGLSKDGVWANLPLSFIVEVLGALRPRLYSISSSSMLAPRKPAITALVVEKPLRNRADESIPGLASTHLRKVSVSSKNELRPSLHVAIRKSKFHPPVATKDIIMIGAGTGIAPFRAFLLERARLHAMSRPVGRTILFFGCRDPKEDYIYREELEQAVANLPGAEIVTAFSRTQYPGKTGRGYVQDAVAARGQELSRMIAQQEARVYVCGRAAMSRRWRQC